MVLQRNSEIKLWGWDNPQELIKVKVSWSKEEFKATTNEEGVWSVTLFSPPAGGPHEIEISGSEVKTISDVLSGEVWVCSGQSNMEWSANHGYNNSDEEVKNANFPKIRLFNVKNTSSETELDNVEGEWQVCSPETIPSFSAVGYLFGRELFQTLNIPIGLIGSEWGGTPSEAWTEKEFLFNNNDYEENNAIYKNTLQDKDVLHPHQPGVLFNGMIAPLLNYKIKGSIWYQGENNAISGRALYYDKVFPGMIENWRARWGYNFPFYYVQLAPYNYPKPYSGSLLREAQLKSLKTPQSGMTVIMDIGNPLDIHPRNKQDVGKRLALWALANDYGMDLDYSGPLYKDYRIEGNKIIVSFDHADEGLMIKGETLKHIAIADSNYMFVRADSKIEGNELIVYNENIQNPKAVRFAFQNGDESNLFDTNGLPASSFRTDNWEIHEIAVQFEPYFDQEHNRALLQLKASEPGDIYYTTDGSDPDLTKNKYLEALPVETAQTIKARFINTDGIPGAVSEITLYIHKAFGKPIILDHPFNKNYSAGGDSGLVDGLKGGEHYTDGLWQGYESDFGATVDLQKETDLNSVSLRFLRHVGAWILLPESVSIKVSTNGKKYKKLKNWKLPAASPNDNPDIISLEYKGSVKNIRYIKIKAKTAGKLPEWHTGKGGQSWIFIDEIEVN